MLSIGEIRERLESFLAGNESLAAFADWLSIESSRMRYDDDAELRKLALSILNRIDVFVDGYIDDASLRNELLRFAKPDEVQAVELRFTFDDVPDQLILIKPDLKPAVSPNSQIQVAVANFA
jgi:hypothetical protein